MNKNKKYKKELKSCVCDNDAYFQRSDEQFRANLKDVEISKEFRKSNHNEDIEIIDEYHNEYTIYDYDIENNQGHEWGNRE